MLSNVRSSNASCETAVLRAQRSAWLRRPSGLGTRGTSPPPSPGGSCATPGGATPSKISLDERSDSIGHARIEGAQRA